jgi:hypothetical protein
MTKDEAGARRYCSSLGWLTKWKSGKGYGVQSGAIICAHPTKASAGSNCNTCATWRLVVFRKGGTDMSPSGQQYKTKPGYFYCGHKPCRGGWNLPQGGVWGRKAVGSMNFVFLKNMYPQNKNPASYCPSDTVYKAHACGTGGVKWRAKANDKVQWGPWNGNQFMDNKYKAHCWTSCNCNLVQVACTRGNTFVDVKKKYPQKAYAGSFCPEGTAYVAHACGKGARKWTGTQKVQWGPYSNNPYLKSGGHCQTSCNCNTVRVQCMKTRR